jgi:hydroxyacylglutathione hydrolase
VSGTEPEPSPSAASVIVDEVSPRVRCIRGTSLSAHAWVVLGDAHVAVVDTGARDRADVLAAGLARLGLAPSDVSIVLHTHEHFDHVGGNGIFPASTLVGAHASAARKMAENDRFVTMLDGPEGSKPTLLLTDGSEIDLGGVTLRALHSPGHTSGSTCFFEPDEGLLFSGDTLFAGGVLSYIAESGSLGDYIASLTRLGMVRIRRILPGHGRPSSDAEGDIARARAAARSLLAGEPAPIRRRGEDPSREACCAGA